MYIRVVLMLTLLGIVQCKLLDLNCNDRKKFVDGHNSRRLKLAKGEVPGHPGAAEMKYMVWDLELASKAADWANKDKYGHNPNRKVGSGRFKVGENIFQYSTTDPNYVFDFDVPMEQWFSEYKDFNYGPMEDSHFGSASKKKVGHYTQMAWANTTYVGCAVSKSKQGKWTKYYVVCNYGPNGNYIGQVPYKRGQSDKLICGTRNCNKLYGPSC